MFKKKKKSKKQFDWGPSQDYDKIIQLNQYLKYLKYGFGHVTDQVIEAIHQGFMSREEAINVVKKFGVKLFL